MKQETIKIRLQAFDYLLIEKATGSIVETVKASGAQIKGPIPMRTRRRVVTVNTSPHVNKDARDQFESRVHTRVLYIINPDAATIDALMRLNLASGVKIMIKIGDGK